MNSDLTVSNIYTVSCQFFSKPKKYLVYSLSFIDLDIDLEAGKPQISVLSGTSAIRFFYCIIITLSPPIKRKRNWHSWTKMKQGLFILANYYDNTRVWTHQGNGGCVIAEPRPWSEAETDFPHANFNLSYKCQACVQSVWSAGPLAGSVADSSVLLLAKYYRTNIILNTIIFLTL